MALDQISAARRKLGLADDSGSDKIWADRLKKGTHSLSDAQAAMGKKASGAQSAADARNKAGLVEDRGSDQLWGGRLYGGTHTQEDMNKALQSKVNNTYNNGGTPTASPKNSGPNPYLREAQVPAEAPVAKHPPIDNFGVPSFDYNPQYEAGMNNINQQRGNINSEGELQRRRMAEDAERQSAEAERQHGLAVESNTERMADGGLVHSGINIKAQADISENLVRFQDQISQAKARGEEDVARWMTGQMQQLQNMQQQLEQQRADAQRAIEEKRAMEEAINKTPQPSPSGRYDLNQSITIGDKAKENATKGDWIHDASFMDDPNRLAGRVEDIFTNRDVVIDSQNETAADRLARITDEVATGQRTLDDVRRSVQRIADMGK